MRRRCCVSLHNHFSLNRLRHNYLCNSALNSASGRNVSSAKSNNKNSVSIHSLDLLAIPRHTVHSVSIAPMSDIECETNRTILAKECCDARSTPEHSLKLWIYFGGKTLSEYSAQQKAHSTRYTPRTQKINGKWQLNFLHWIGIYMEYVCFPLGSGLAPFGLLLLLFFFVLSLVLVQHTHQPLHWFFRPRKIRKDFLSSAETALLSLESWDFDDCLSMSILCNCVKLIENEIVSRRNPLKFNCSFELTSKPRTWWRLFAVQLHTQIVLQQFYFLFFFKGNPRRTVFTVNFNVTNFDGFHSQIMN